jgi:hypothetical protein
MCMERGESLKAREARLLIVDSPYIALALNDGGSKNPGTREVEEAVQLCYFQRPDTNHLRPTSLNAWVYLQLVTRNTAHQKCKIQGVRYDIINAHQVMETHCIRQIPLFDASRLVAGYKLHLVWVHTYIIYYMRLEVCCP